MFLPYGRQSIDDDDIDAVVEVLRGPMLTQGPAVDAFEALLAEKLGAEHAIVCSNGTAALHLASMALGLGPGDVVVVPAITFVATANAPAMTGAQVVFADVDPATGLLTAETLEEALGRARALGTPKAVFPVQLNGQCAAMREIADVARTAGLAIVEDACHAVGGRLDGPDGASVPVGSCAWSDMAAFSFHPVKTIAMGEGGAVTVNDAERAATMRLHRNHGITREPKLFTRAAAFDADGEANPWYYEMLALGWNYRAPDILCALGLSQLRKLEHFVETRRGLVAAYDAALPALAPLARPLARLPHQTPSWHLYPVRIDFEAARLGRAGTMQALRERGVGTQVHYIPVPDQPYWRARVDTPPLPGAAAYYDAALSLPLFADMSDADVGFVVDALADVLGVN